MQANFEVKLRETQEQCKQQKDMTTRLEQEKRSLQENFQVEVEKLKMEKSHGEALNNQLRMQVGQLEA